MSRFVLTAQLQLQAPNNVGQIVKTIQSQLNNVQVNVQVQGTQQAQRQVQSLAKSINSADSAAKNMGRTFAASIKKFSALAIATRAVSLFTNRLSSAIEESISFERELVKISQVTGKSLQNLKNLSNTITQLSTSLGASSSSLLQVGRILSQAGFSADEATIALKTLAKTELAPTFDDITQTAEGAVAIFNQFRLGAEALESQLGSINAVAGKFAVEASDLIATVRRVGGVFKASGGDLNELIALFTSVRATTRESAESIATGLRTIFTRIQRPETIQFLKQFGVELLDVEGKFVGPYEAVKRLSGALAGLEQGDITFIRIAEELGGFRQIGKVIPLLQQFSIAQQALNVAQQGGTSLSKDAANAQQALAVRILKVKEEYLALVRGITETPTFQIMANTALSLASSLAKVLDNLKPILPIITAIAAVRFAQGIGGFLGGLGGGLGGRKFATGGKVHAFARGGIVPGSGNRDTVPAMLTPGEFVIRKSSVAKLGAGNLEAMNNNRYAKGGKQNAIQKGAQSSGVGIFDSDMISDATQKKLVLEQIKASKKPYQVIAGPAGAGKTTFATGRFGRNFVMSGADIGKYSKFVVLSGAGKTKTGDFSDNTKSLLSGASDITVLSPSPERLMAQRQGRLDSAMSGQLPDTRSVSGLQGTLRAPTDINEDLYRQYNNVNFLQEYATGGKVDIKVDPGAVGGFFLTPDKGVDRNFDLSKGNAVGKKITNPNVISSISGGGDLSDDQLLASLSVAARARVFGAGTSASKDAAYKSTAFNSNTSVPIGNGVKKTFKELGPEGKKRLKQESNIGTSTTTDGLEVASLTGQGVGFLPGRDVKQNAQISSAVGLATQKILTQGVTEGAQRILSLGNFGSAIKLDESGLSGADRLANDPNAKSSVEGFLFEGIIDAITGATLAGNQAAFDFPYSSLQSNKPALERFFTPTSSIGNLINADAKRSLSLKDTIASKIVSDINTGNTRGYTITKRLDNKKPQKFATGGPVGTDTVPALLTPGEFVINKSAAKYIGYNNLRRMNKVGRYARGGIVQRFANGTTGPAGVPPPVPSAGLSPSQVAAASQRLQASLQAVASAAQASAQATNQNAKANDDAKKSAFGLGGGLTLALSTAQGLIKPLDENSSALARVTHSLLSMGTSISVSIAALEAFGLQLNAQSIKSFLIDRKSEARDRVRVAVKRGVQSAGSTVQAAGSAVGKVSPILGSGISSLGKGISGVAKLLGNFAGALGPAIAVVGAFAVVNNIVGAFRDLDGQLKDAIKVQDTAKAQQLAMSKANADAIPLIGNLVGGIADLVGGTEWLTSVFAYIGGPSVDSIKANIDAQIQSTKTQKALADAQTESTRALEDFKNGNITAAEALQRVTNLTNEAFVLQSKNNKVIEENNKQRSTGVGAFLRNAGAMLGGGLFGMELASTRNRRLDTEGETANEATLKAMREAFATQQATLNAAMREAVLRGDTTDIRTENIDPLRDQAIELRKQAQARLRARDAAGAKLFEEQAKLLSEQANLTEKALANIEKEVETARKKFEALNLGFRSIIAASDAMAVKVSNTAASFEAGFVPAVASAKLLETAMTAAGQNISSAEVDKALQDVVTTMSTFGADPEQIRKFKENTSALAAVQRGFPEIFEKMKEDIKKGGFTGMSAEAAGEAFKKQVESQLAGMGIGEDVRQRIIEAMGQVELSPDDIQKIAIGDFSPLENILGDAGEEVKKVMDKLVNNLANINKELIQVTKARIEAERKLVEAQKEAANLMMEGREIQAKFGGQAITTDERRQDIIARANFGAAGAGIGNLTTGNLADLRIRNQQIAQQSQIFEAQAAQEGGLAGVGGVKAAEQQENVRKAYQDQIQTIRELIKLEEQELNLIKEKNKVEKDSIDSLLAGDLDKFFQQQAAAGATAAIALGNQDLINAFGASALGMAAQDIRRQQEAGQTSLFGQQIGGAGGLAERGFGAAIGAMGIADPRLAQIAAGTTAEELAAQQRLQDLGSALGEIGQIGIDMAQMTVDTATIQAATVELRAGQAAQQLGMARGGLVYANRGLFVPRGTDTIPAMLTPGEFVVRREAVQRGNNLALLQAMNRSNGSSSATSSGGAVAMSHGGEVIYRRRGSTGAEVGGGGFGFDPDLINKLSVSLNSFNTSLSANIDKLNQTNLNIKLDTTNINVNLTGTSFLGKLKDDIKQELLTEVAGRIRNYRVGDDGQLRESGNIT